MFEIGTNGHTSVAPILGCSPLCSLISINFCAFLINRNAASTTSFGSPTNVITVLLVAFPGSTLSSLTPLTVSTTFAISFIFFISIPSEIFGTHSINCFISFNLFNKDNILFIIN